jgi:hypothetical protein
MTSADSCGIAGSTRAEHSLRELLERTKKWKRQGIC